jgi:hypothetical protein
VLTAVLEGKARSVDEVLDRARREDLIRFSHRDHSSCDVDGESTDVIGATADLTRVHSDADLNPGCGSRRAQFLCTSQGTSGGVEDRQSPVSELFDDSPSVMPNASIHARFVNFENLQPACVTDAL